MSAPLFIIGAGFNVDANAEAGEVPVSSAYPLVGQLAEICFGLMGPPFGKSVEQLRSRTSRGVGIDRRESRVNWI